MGDRPGSADVLSATELTAGEDFRLSEESPAIEAGAVEPRLFEDFHGNPRPGTDGNPGTPSLGAIEP